MHPLLISIFTALFLSTDDGGTSTSCPTGQLPDACENGFCTPHLGVPPDLDKNICCHIEKDFCYLPETSGCKTGYVKMHCDSGKSSGSDVTCMFGVSTEPLQANDDQFCCDAGGAISRGRTGATSPAVNGSATATAICSSWTMVPCTASTIPTAEPSMTVHGSGDRRLLLLPTPQSQSVAAAAGGVEGGR